MSEWVIWVFFGRNDRMIDTRELGLVTLGIRSLRMGGGIISVWWLSLIGRERERGKVALGWGVVRWTMDGYE